MHNLSQYIREQFASALNVDPSIVHVYNVTEIECIYALVKRDPYNVTMYEYSYDPNCDDYNFADVSRVCVEITFPIPEFVADDEFYFD